MSKINRLCIYVVYDKDGIVDDYIPYFLDALSPFVEKFVIVCNGKLNDEGRVKLSKFTTDVFVRPNEGYDAGAVKDVLFNLFGWEKVYRFDELLICNDTFYGPLYPLSECFDKMDFLNVDFWGLMLHRAQMYNLMALEEHVQSYFINVKNRLLRSYDFKRFFDNMKVAKNAYEAMRFYEEAVTKTFRDAGYKYDVYLKPLKNSADNIKNYNPFVHDAVELVRDFRYPIIKKKTLQRTQMDIDTEQYVSRKTELLSLANRLGYKIELIADNLKRMSESVVTELKSETAWIDFTKRAGTLYIYGAGAYADMVATALDKNAIEYTCFICTDGYPKHDEFHNHPCKYLAEVEFKDGDGVILALDSKNRAQVEPLLIQRGVKNYIMV